MTEAHRELGEHEHPPVYRIVIARHAERTATGELRPEGIEKARALGQQVGASAELFKGYASQEKTDRTFKTSEFGIESSGAEPRAGAAVTAPFGTRRAPGLQYDDVLAPNASGTLTDLRPLIKRASGMIDEATLNEPELIELGITKANLRSTDHLADVTQLIGQLRQKNQDVGFEYLLGNEQDFVRREAGGLANQLVRELELIGVHRDKRQRAGRPLEKDVVVQTTTHGSFIEALLLEAGSYRDKAGQQHQFTAADFTAPWFGGQFIQPTEALFFDLDPTNVAPDRVGLSFTAPSRPAINTVWLDLDKVYELAGEYQRLRSETGG